MSILPSLPTPLRPRAPRAPRATRGRRPEPRTVALHARDVAFDWAGLPLRWVPGEAFASQMINVMHLLLPEGERWFVRVFSEVLPMIQDDRLREEVLGFIGQEGMHASAHQGVADYFEANGVEVASVVGDIEHVFRRLLGDRGLTGADREEWLVESVAIIAGIEHMTAFLGHWVLNSPGLDAADADPRMLDLLRWHGAEEVEHRNVAYDLYRHLDGRYLRRQRTYALAAFGLVYLWARTTRHLLEQDERPGLATSPPAMLLRWADGARRGLLPGMEGLVLPALRYLSPWYHPIREGSTAQAVAYLASSPAAIAAEAS